LTPACAGLFEPKESGPGLLKSAFNAENFIRRLYWFISSHFVAICCWNVRCSQKSLPWLSIDTLAYRRMVGSIIYGEIYDHCKSGQRERCFWVYLLSIRHGPLFLRCSFVSSSSFGISSGVVGWNRRDKQLQLSDRLQANFRRNSDRRQLQISDRKDFGAHNFDFFHIFPRVVFFWPRMLHFRRQWRGSARKMRNNFATFLYNVGYPPS